MCAIQIICIHINTRLLIYLIGSLFIFMVFQLTTFGSTREGLQWWKWRGKGVAYKYLFLSLIQDLGPPPLQRHWKGCDARNYPSSYTRTSDVKWNVAKLISRLKRKGFWASTWHVWKYLFLHLTTNIILPLSPPLYMVCIFDFIKSFGNVIHKYF